MAEQWDQAIDDLSALVDPVRRSMYRFVRAEGRPVSRDEVAAATGTSVKLAAFHLDKLVQSGWLRAEAARSLRTPKGGRPPKLYAPTPRQVELSLPVRRYDLMAEILLEASGGGTEDVAAAAFKRGRACAEESRWAGRRRVGAPRTLAAALELLAELGFEPRRTAAGEVVAANCPFRSLAETAPDTVCRAAEAFAEGIVAGLAGSGVEACADRAPDRCCLTLRPTPRL